MTEPREAPPEYDFCSRCKEHTGWEWHDDEERFLSECCSAGPISVDVEPPDA